MFSERGMLSRYNKGLNVRCIFKPQVLRYGFMSLLSRKERPAWPPYIDLMITASLSGHARFAVRLHARSCIDFPASLDIIG